MVTEKRLIDANDYPCIKCGKSYCYENCNEFRAWLNNTVNAVPIDDIKLHHIMIDQNGIPEVKLQFGERTIILRREGDPVDVRVFVNGQWRTVYDDSAGWVNECSKCKEFGDGTPYCPNCGAKMDGDGNG